MKKDQGDKLKFNEWRPIGVCDTAPPGEQKAQMFTREDYLIVTAPGVNRHNWRRNTEVMKILSRYSRKLAKQSSMTRGMKKAVASKMTLVGAIMRLGITPTLNKESEDGKLQLFQIEFKDKGLKKEIPWLLIIAIVLGIVLLLLIAAIIAKQINKPEQYKTGRLRPRSLTVSFCTNSETNRLYPNQLDEVRRILQTKTDDLLFRGSLHFDPECSAKLPSIKLKEDRFLKCYSILTNNRVLSRIPTSDLRKINACRNEICGQTSSRASPACQAAN